MSKTFWFPPGFALDRVAIPVSLGAPLRGIGTRRRPPVTFSWARSPHARAGSRNASRGNVSRAGPLTPAPAWRFHVTQLALGLRAARSSTRRPRAASTASTERLLASPRDISSSARASRWPRCSPAARERSSRTVPRPRSSNSATGERPRSRSPCPTLLPPARRHQGPPFHDPHRRGCHRGQQHPLHDRLTAPSSTSPTSSPKDSSSVPSTRPRSPNGSTSQPSTTNWRETPLAQVPKPFVAS